MKKGQVYLDGRLRQVAAFVPSATSAADIGTDHAYLAISLVQAGQVKKMIAADKNRGPLDAASRMVEEAGCIDRIDLRLGDGLAVLAPGEVETVILAGMGGELMMAILEAQPSVRTSLKTLILQPMADAEILRKYLYTHGWHIEREALAEADGRIYEVLCLVQGEKTMPAPIELYLGPYLMQERPPLWNAYIDARLAKLESVHHHMAASETARQSEKYRELEGAYRGDKS